MSGCERPLKARGYCNPHYKRLVAYGDPTAGGAIREKRTAEERFWEKVDQSGGPDACWPWTGNRTPDGYGHFSWRAVRHSCLISARVSFFFANGYWPTETLHDCDNPPCVNPAHLREGSHRENQRDSSSRGQWHGELAPSRKLSNAEVAEIRAAVRAGQSQTAVALRFGVHQSTVSRVVRRETWSRTT